ncbi:Eukaryotic translation initiation factor 4E type 2 [Rhizophlyctis rosea]|uniref:Eukaryotic translation initiation factor 4E type 2 n=1 Tax=Rhizophlyctis rosea TaxID=64517 RepID=A0AAD5SBM4_9FUNG|nr:Eukaryotic translation initiation factor 4E type 2 [Rhizophlyctis rosea]
MASAIAPNGVWGSPARTRISLSVDTNDTGEKKKHGQADGGGGGGATAGAAGGASAATTTATPTAVQASKGPHNLRFSWVFWFMHREPGSKIQDYNNSIKKLGTFGTVEEFWGVYSRVRRPMDLPNISDYHLFKQGTRPIWEDNLNGGKWIVRLKKGLASRYWESLVMAIVGDQFDVGGEICGAVISIRHSEDILSLWNQSADDGRVNLRIRHQRILPTCRDTMKRVLNLPPNCIMEYKAHKSSVADNSSFRNTEMFR